MKQLQSSSRRLMLEQVEDRRLLAGFVQASISGGNLLLTGDWAQNEIAIYRGANANQVVVSGIDTGSGPTRVNGKLQPVVLNGFTGSIIGNMNEGSDHVLITNLAVPGSVLLNGQNGNDQIALSNGFALPAGALNTGAAVPNGNVSVKHDVIINTGAGHDTVLLANCAVGDDVELHGEQGNDNFNVIGSRDRAYPKINDTLLFFPGAGDDVVFTDYLKVGGFLEVHDTQATTNSTVVISQTTVNKDLNIFTSPQNDFISVRARVGNFNAFSGAGDDALFIQLPASRYNYVNLGDGNDTLFIDDTVAIDYTVDAGAGDDSVNVSFSTVDRAFAYLGSGDDTFTAANSTANKSVNLYGGPGKNTLLNFGGNNFKELNRYDI
jgi:hypothetical protein